MADKNDILYAELMNATKDGKSAEVKRNAEGGFTIYTVTKKKKEVKLTTA